MSLADRDGVIWLDGKYVDWREANVHVLTHTLHYGVGVFEGVRAYHSGDKTTIFRLDKHTERLFRSAHILNMKVPYDYDTLMEVQQEIIKKNALKAAYIRPMIFYSADYLGLHTKNLKIHVMVAAWEWGAYWGDENEDNTIRAHTSTMIRSNVNSVYGKAKANGNYINSIMALQEVQALGYDEALMLDPQGWVAEGSSANFFIVRDGVIYTPTTANILEGITREATIKIARDLGIEVIEKNIVRDDVYIADEAFFTGTAAEITACGELDGRVIGSGKRGPITKQLQQVFTGIVQGEQPQYDAWLTHLELARL